MPTKLVNGIRVNLTADEVTAREAEEAEWAAGADDRAAERVRAERSRILAETDYFALTDNTLSNAMRQYRKDLRDITAQAGFPHNVTWPTKPSE